MRLKIRTAADFAAGVLFTVIGAGFAVASRNYELGTTSEMGPGYFPFGLGILLTLLGLGVIASSLSVKRDVTVLPRLDLKIAFFVLAPVILFALFLDQLGFVLALFLVVLGSSFACRELRWNTALMSAVMLVAISVVLFVGLLKVQVGLWPAFVG